MKTLRWPTTVTALAAATLLAAVGCERSGALPPASAPAGPAAGAAQSAPVTGAAQGAPSKAAQVDAARLAAPEPEQWVTPGRDAAGTYFSPLTDINAGNVAQLGFAWDYRLGTNRGQESTPLVIDGVMYATSNFGRVYALDAATGKELWTYDPHIDGQWARYACCDAVNRGLAAFDGPRSTWARSTAGCMRWMHAPASACGRSIR